MRDSYERFFNHFDIQIHKLIEFGVEQDTIYPDPKNIRGVWESLVDDIKKNRTVYIRGYGRDAHGTILYQELYKILLKHNNIVKDPTNNYKPTQLLQRITNFSKTIKADNSKKEKIINYQVSHIFGRTKTPFLFTAPWNIVWKPKILDPFTGHESKGEYTVQYKKRFIEKSKLKYSDFINEYNKLAAEYFSEKDLIKAVKQLEKSSEGIMDFEKFKDDVLNELKPINI